MRKELYMRRFPTIVLILFTLAGISIGCQSEDEKRASRLREQLHQDITQIEAVNNKFLNAKEALYNLKMEHKDGGAAPDLKALDKDRATFPAELEALRSQIDTTPNASLLMLSHGIQATLKYQQQRLKEIQSYSATYVERWSPEAIKKDNEAWREAWRPRIFSGRPDGPLVFGDGDPPTSSSTSPKKEDQ